MLTRHREAGSAPLPSPFPEGWYFVAYRRDVLKARLIQKTWMGEKIVIWCDDDGRVCVAHAFCPHLGSYLGPDAGGRVSGGRLVCPFHGFEYDATGQCVATPFAPHPEPRGCESSRPGKSPALSSPGGAFRGERPNGTYRRRRRTKPAGAAFRSGLRGFPAIPRRPRRTRWTWSTYATSTATTAWTALAR